MKISQFAPYFSQLANLVRVLIASVAALISISPSFAATGFEAESWLGLPVTYADRSYALHPWPAIELKDIKILTSDVITINRAWLSPDWAEWITTAKTNRVRLMADQIVARPSALARLGLVDGKSTRKVTSLHFARLKLLISNGYIDLPGGEMDFAPDGTMARIKVQFEDKITIEGTPKDGKLSLTLQTAQWKWSALPVFLFDNLVAQGELSNEEIVFDRIGANADGGVVSGNMRLLVTDKFAMEGELKLAGMNAKDVLGRLYARHTVLGNLNAIVKVASTADNFAGLGKELVASGTYNIVGGSIDRMGLLEGLRKVGAGPAGGGLTRFARLEGGFSGQTDKPASVTMQRLDAGAMQGSGSFTVMPDSVLKGTVSASMRLPSGETTSRNLGLTGKVDSPTLTVR